MFALAVLVLGLAACSSKNISVAPSPATPDGPQGQPTHPVIEVTRMSGNLIAVRLWGELKIGLAGTYPTFMKDGSQNTISAVRLYDYSCGVKKVFTAQFGSSTPRDNTASTYKEMETCGTVDFEFALQFADTTVVLHTLDYAVILPGTLNVRRSGSHVISDSFPK
jgi:hypothetical protein